MSQSKKYTINTRKAISETIEGETIIIDLETGSYYSMNPSATALWNAILEENLIPVDKKNILDFVQNLESEGLILESSSSADKPLADISQFSDPKLEKYDDMQEMLLADPVHDVENTGWPNLKKK